MTMSRSISLPFINSSATTFSGKVFEPKSLVRVAAASAVAPLCRPHVSTARLCAGSSLPDFFMHCLRCLLQSNHRCMHCVHLPFPPVAYARTVRPRAGFINPADVHCADAPETKLFGGDEYKGTLEGKPVSIKVRFVCPLRQIRLPLRAHFLSHKSSSTIFSPACFATFSDA